MRFRFVYCEKLLCLLFLFGAFYVQPAFAQKNELSLKEITIALQSTSGDYSKEERLTFIAEQVEVRGVDFLFTPTNENTLKEAGATPELLEAIREESMRATASASDITKAKELAYLGKQFYDQNDYEKAVEHYQRSIELNPRYSYGYASLAEIYYTQKNYEKAIEFYSKAIAAKADPLFYSNRGAAYFAIKKYDKAVRDYTQVIELQPTSVKAYMNRGSAYLYIDADKAIEDYEKVLELDPQNKEVLKKLENAKRSKELKETKNNESPE